MKSASTTTARGGCGCPGRAGVRGLGRGHAQELGGRAVRRRDLCAAGGRQMRSRPTGARRRRTGLFGGAARCGGASPVSLPGRALRACRRHPRPDWRQTRTATRGAHVGSAAGWPNGKAGDGVRRARRRPSRRMKKSLSDASLPVTNSSRNSLNRSNRRGSHPETAGHSNSKR